MFYSKLANLFTPHPEEASLAGKQNIAGIAKTWKVEIPVIEVIVKPEVEPLADGLSPSPSPSFTHTHSSCATHLTPIANERTCGFFSPYNILKVLVLKEHSSAK